MGEEPTMNGLMMFNGLLQNELSKANHVADNGTVWLLERADFFLLSGGGILLSALPHPIIHKFVPVRSSFPASSE